MQYPRGGGSGPDAIDLLRENGEDHCYSKGEEDGAGEVAQFYEESPHGDNFAGWRLLITVSNGVFGVSAGVRVTPEEEHERDECGDGYGGCGEEVGEG